MRTLDGNFCKDAEGKLMGGGLGLRMIMKVRVV